MFPLTLFPLPGELVPLHIFEPRYRQLLEDAETRDFSFGIYFNHTTNVDKLGSLMRLESIIKKYPGGESDIIVRCTDLFAMETMFRTHRDRLYPGGEVEYWNIDTSIPASEKLTEEFQEYLSMMKMTPHDKIFSAWDIAAELSLEFDDKLKFVHFDAEKQASFLSTRLTYSKHLLIQAEKAKDVFHLN